MSPRKVSIAELPLLLAACGGGGSGGGGPAPVLEVVKWPPSGGDQTDTVGQALPNVLCVKVPAPTGVRSSSRPRASISYECSIHPAITQGTLIVN